MKSEGLKPSQLAELLEINPAGISHILAGRNKPGFDLLQKILRRFPRISPDWLILDSGNMYRDDSAVAQPIDSGLFGKESEIRTTATPHNDQVISPAQSSGRNEPTAITSQTANTHATARRIVIFYDDDTFEFFTHSKQ
ncbi:helix-turn-helix transcriptional regulator [uncultured Alistipes sp.]|nr:helix-turn-helix transcriptional regulator [uncultured Alistipes sp.]DAN30536.1 MAG TPA: Helix-turn-helix XRE-family like protein [Crassvirales sp.]